MRVGHLLKFAVAVGIPAGLLTGCRLLDAPSDRLEEDKSWESTTDLVSEYGGYDFTDERDGFADPEVMKIEAEENAVAAADSDTVRTPNAFAVRILWGQLRGNPEAEEIIDWSGAFRVSSGRLAVLRTIAFERRTDRLLPRDDRQVVPYESLTRPHFDGLLLLVHDSENDAAATLTMDSGPYSGSWTFEELRGANLVIPVDDLGNAVSVTGITLPDDPACLSGSVRGHWVKRPDQRGVFRGLWMTHFGRPVGYIRGHYGTNDAGERLWFGKIIGKGGHVLGLARGTWEPSDDSRGGTFQGHWAARPGERSGVVAGHYMPVESDRRDGAAGFFHGRWKSNCDGSEEPVPGDEPPADNRS